VFGDGIQRRRAVSAAASSFSGGEQFQRRRAVSAAASSFSGGLVISGSFLARGKR
jgi:hypothetical protein